MLWPRYQPQLSEFSCSDGTGRFHCAFSGPRQPFYQGQLHVLYQTSVNRIQYRNGLGCQKHETSAARRAGHHILWEANKVRPSNIYIPILILFFFRHVEQALEVARTLKCLRRSNTKHVHACNGESLIKASNSREGERDNINHRHIASLVFGLIIFPLSTGDIKCQLKHFTASPTQG